MAKYKIGDRVLVESKIINADEKEPKYFIKTRWGENKWAYENEVHPIPAKDTKTYEDGMRDAWEMAMCIASRDVNAKEPGYTNEELRGIFGVENVAAIMRRNTAAEAADKIAAWEESKRINVGDVVEVGEKGTESFVGTAVVTNVYTGGYYLVFGDGESGDFGSEGLTKTGRHIDVGGLLEQIRSEDE